MSKIIVELKEFSSLLEKKKAVMREGEDGRLHYYAEETGEELCYSYPYQPGQTLEDPNTTLDTLLKK